MPAARRGKRTIAFSLLSLSCSFLFLYTVSSLSVAGGPWAEGFLVPQKPAADLSKFKRKTKMGRQAGGGPHTSQDGVVCPV